MNFSIFLKCVIVTARLGVSGHIPPVHTASILLDNCRQVDLNTRILNMLPSLENITVRNVNTLILHQKVILNILVCFDYEV